MKLIPNWKKAWRMLSINFAALALAWIAVPPEQQAKVMSLLPWLTPDQVSGVLIAAAMIGRLVAQPKVQQ